jgi:hypothetical protein
MPRGVSHDRRCRCSRRMDGAARRLRSATRALAMTCWIIMQLWWLGTLGGLTLQLVSPLAPLSLAVWFVAGIAWHAKRDALRAAELVHWKRMSPSVLLPAALLLQCFLDWFFMLGSLLVVLGNFAWITAIVRGSDYPTARARFSRPRRSAEQGALVGRTAVNAQPAGCL